MKKTASLEDQIIYFGQEHLLRHRKTLSGKELELFNEQLLNINFEEVHQIFSQKIPEKNVIYEPPQITTQDRLKTPIYEIGVHEFKSSRVARVTAAGGSGTRLGFNKPKGMFPISAVLKKTLFELQAEDTLHAQEKYGSQIPWLIMTSSQTHEATQDYFSQNNNFGLEVFLFQQDDLPVLDQEGKIILKSKTEILFSANGHGGLYKALHDNNLISKLQKRKIKELAYFQIDNPLATINDPWFLGAHLAKGSEFSTKVVEKIDPEEKVGILTKQGMLEYIMMTDEQKQRKDATGKLAFRAANIAIHLIDLNLVSRYAANTLQYYEQQKTVEQYQSDGSFKNIKAKKRETFVFAPTEDPAITQLVYSVPREESFAPVKNAQGNDSPETARELINAMHKSWLYAAIEAQPENERIITLDRAKQLRYVEISPRRASNKNEFIASFKPYVLEEHQDYAVFR